MFDEDQFPDRPDHPDFWALADVVLKCDGRAQEEADGFESILTEIGIDIESFVYMAQQRGLRLALLTGTDLASATTAWMEGFVIGELFERRQRG